MHAAGAFSGVWNLRQQEVARGTRSWYDHYSYLFQAPEWTPAEEKIPGLGADLDVLKLTQYVG